MVLAMAEYHTHNCTPQTFKQFATTIRNRDYQHSVQPGFELRAFRLWVCSRAECLATTKYLKRKKWPNVGLMLGHRLRRWPTIKPTLDQYRVYLHCRLSSIPQRRLDSHSTSAPRQSVKKKKNTNCGLHLQTCIVLYSATSNVLLEQRFRRNTLNL